MDEPCALCGEPAAVVYHDLNADEVKMLCLDCVNKMLYAAMLPELSNGGHSRSPQ
jgi:hypothetical protein